MKTTLPLVLAGIAIGFAGGWLAKPAPATDEASTGHSVRSAKRTESRASSVTGDQPKSSKRSQVTIIENGEVKEMTPESEQNIKDLEKKQKDMVRKRLEKKYDLEIAAMVRELGLNPEQEKALRSFYAERLEEIVAVDSNSMMSDPELLKDLAATMRGDGLNDYMKDQLTSEQMESLEAMQKRQYQNNIEARAMNKLANLQKSLDLTEEQENQAYAILTKDAEKQLSEQSDADYIMRSYMETMGMGFHVGDDDMGSIFQMQEAAKDGGDPADLIAQIKQNRQAEVDRKVGLMEPVLDDGQLKQYRSQLENQGGFIDMMIQGMENN